MGLKASGELLRGSRFLGESLSEPSSPELKLYVALLNLQYPVLIPPSGSDSLHGTKSSQDISTHNLRSYTLLVHYLVQETGRQMYNVYCYKDLF